MQEENKVGAGILTICILTIIGAAFNIFGNILLLGFHDFYKDIFNQIGTELPGTGITTIYLLISILLIVSAALILKKNKVGVIGYFVLEATSLILSLILSEVTVLGILLDLVLPVLMIIFVSKKKDLYFNN